MNIFQRLYENIFRPGQQITPRKVISARKYPAAAGIDGLSPKKLGMLLRMSESGDTPAVMRLFREMELRDPYLRSMLYKRKLAVVNKQLLVQPVAKDKKSMEIAAFVENLFSFKDMRNSLMDHLDCIGKGYSVSEIYWQIENGQVGIEAISHIEPDRFDFYNPDGTIVNKLDDINYVKEDGSRMKLRPRNRFLMGKFHMSSTHPLKQGLIRSLAFWYVFKNYSVKDWLAFQESYGIPVKTAYYRQNEDEDTVNRIVDSLKALSSQAVAAFPEGTAVEIIDAVKSGQPVHKVMADYAHLHYAVLILGQQGTTEVGSSGSYAAHKVLSDVQDAITDFDCLELAEDLFYQIVVPAVVWQYGPQERYPRIYFDTKSMPDKEKEARVIEIALRNHIKLKAEEVYTNLGYTKPAENDDVITSSTEMEEEQE